MKVKNILLSLAVLGCIGANAADTTTNAQGSKSNQGANTQKSTSNSDAISSLSSQTINQLVQEMQQANVQNRYKYMNAIKTKIGTMNQQKREAKIKEIENKVKAKREETFEKMSEKAQQEKQNMQNKAATAEGMANGMGGMSSGSGIGGMGGMGSGGGMGGMGSGGGMGGGSGAGGSGGSGW